MSSPFEYQAIIAKNKRNGESHTLIWEKGNTPKESIVLNWFAKLFGGGVKQWKILSKKKWIRQKEWLRQQ